MWFVYICRLYYLRKKRKENILVLLITLCCPDRLIHTELYYKLYPYRVILQTYRKRKKNLKFYMCPDLLNPYRVFQQTVVKRKKEKKKVLCDRLIYTGLYYNKIMQIQGKKRRNYMFYESLLIQSYYRLQKHG